MDWQEFEQLVAKIYSNQEPKGSIAIKGVGATCRLTGKSGVSHQIDVLTEHRSGIHTYRTAVECKYWEQKIDKDPIMKLLAIKADCDLHQAVIISRIGFTDDAMKFGVYHGIELWLLDEHNFFKKGEVEKRLYMHWEFEMPEMISKSLHVGPAYTEDKLKNALKGYTLGDVFFQDSDKNIISYKDLQSAFLQKDLLASGSRDIVCKTFPLPAGAHLRLKEVVTDIPVHSVVLEGFVNRFTMLDNDYFEGPVMMLLQHAIKKAAQYNVTITGELKPRPVRPAFRMETYSVASIKIRGFSRNLNSGEIEEFQFRSSRTGYCI